MRNVVAALFAASLLTAFALFGLEKSDPQAEALPAVPAPEGYKPVIETHDLMEGVDENFQGLKKDLETPDDRKARRSAYKKSLLLAEIMNIVPHFESDEVQGEAKRKKWDEIAHSVRDEFLKLAAAIKAGNAAEAATLGKKVEATCESCHDMRE